MVNRLFVRICQGAVLGVALLVAVFAGGQAAAGNNRMPHFALPAAVDGEIVDSAKYQGQVLLITFFATWCPPCIQEIPALIELQKDYGRQGFSVIGLSVDEGGRKGVARLINKMGINYPVLMADKKVTRDFGGIFGIPVSFLVNRQAEVIKNYPGYVGHAELERDIKQVMALPPAAGQREAGAADGAGQAVGESVAPAPAEKKQGWLQRLLD